MSVENTGHSLQNRISNKKRQYRNGRPDKTKRPDDVERKKDISKRTISETSKDSEVSFSTKYRSDIERRKKIKI